MVPTGLLLVVVPPLLQQVMSSIAYRGIPLQCTLALVSCPDCTSKGKGLVTFATYPGTVRKIRKDRNEISHPTEVIIVRSTIVLFPNHTRREVTFLGLYVKLERNFAELPMYIYMYVNSFCECDWYMYIA